MLYDFVWSLIAGIFAFPVLATLAHDAAHGSLSSQFWLNRIILIITFGKFEIAGNLWRCRHVRLHEVFPNTEGLVIDGQGSSIIRSAPHGEWRWWHRYVRRKKTSTHRGRIDAGLYSYKHSRLS